MTKHYTEVSAPIGVAGQYPSHLAKWGKGGLHIVADNTERDALWDALKDPSLRVYVMDSKKFFLWDTDNSQWTEDEFVDVSPSSVKKADALHGGETALSGSTVAPPDEHRHRETSIGALAYFENEVIPSGGHGFVWPSNWVFNDTFITLDMAGKTIQLNTMPDAPEDTHYLISMPLAFEGTVGDALSYTSSLIDGDTDSVLLDVNGDPMQESVNLVQGQPYPSVHIFGIVKVHDLKKIKIQIVNRLSNDLDLGTRVDHISGIMIQELAPGHAGGLPLITHQMDIGKRFAVGHSYMGKGFAGLNYNMKPYPNLTVFKPGDGGYDSDDWALFVKNKALKTSSGAYGLRLKSFDDPDHIRDLSMFCVCKKIVGERLELLKQSGSTITATAKTNSPLNSFKMRAVAYKGDISKINTCPITGYNDYNVLYAPGFSEIVEGKLAHPVDGVHTESESISFTVPKDADGVVICFGQPDALSEPFDITINDITLDASPAGQKWEVELKDL